MKKDKINKQPDGDDDDDDDDGDDDDDDDDGDDDEVSRNFKLKLNRLIYHF